ncbi:hypothetical protein [Enterococcus sp. AZ109]|uniref:hypothetical protein n=1 Tax=Enterococcus sp. AZ109 TaxID=2774634 RepID=UPI003F295F7D
MMNYLISENYRIQRVKRTYAISFLCLFAVIAAALVLKFSAQMDPNFRYGTASFYYSNLLAMNLLLIAISFLFSNVSNNNMEMMKYSISFGISRQTIFWGKLVVSLTYFTLLCAICLAAMLIFGQSLLPYEADTLSNFLKGVANMIPLILSAYVLGYILGMNKQPSAINILILLVIYGVSGDIVRAALHPFPSLAAVYRLFPSTLFTDNLLDFMNQSIHIRWECWAVGLAITIGSLIWGLSSFSKRDI